MTIPIIGRDDSFPALVDRVRKTVLAKHGKHHGNEYLMLLGLIELLWVDKADRVRVVKEEERPG